MGREREVNWKELSLKARIESLKAAESVLSGKVVWWEMAGQLPIDERGAELAEMRRRGEGMVEFLPPAIRAVREKGERAIVLILSGGGALGPIHIGIIGALLEAGIPIDLVVGTSAGAIGAIIASRMTSLEAWVRAKQMAGRVSWDELRVEGAFKRGGWWAMEKLAGYIDDNITQFERSTTEMILAVVDISRFPQQRLRAQWAPIEGATWGQMVQASCSVPGWMAPLTIGEARLWDGGAKFGEGFLPIAIAGEVVPRALAVSVRLGPSTKKNGKDTAEVLIEPCRGRRDKVQDMWTFDQRDVYLGFMVGMAEVGRIWALMEERGIERVYLPGFGEGRAIEYFEEKEKI